MLSVLRLWDVSASYGTGDPVLEHVSLDLLPGWTALVGANGEGKTTLLRILAGELAPSEGERLLRPNAAVIAMCPQDVDRLSRAILLFAEERSEIHSRLHLDPKALLRWDTLSPGERKRWQIGAALSRQPDVLLLDEPTNHLDREAILLLQKELSAFRGIGVVVSHDRDLLDRFARTTVRVKRGGAKAYEGSYSEASKAWGRERVAEQAAYAEGKKRVRARSRALDDARRVQASAERSRSTRTRMKSARDHDARSASATYRAESAEARASRAVGTARTALERERTNLPFIEKDRTLGGDMFVRFQRASSPTLFHLDETELRAGDRTVLRDVRLSIGRTDRVRVSGKNGAGKTTLLKALFALSRAEVLYLPQEMSEAERRADLDAVRALDSSGRGEIMAIVAAFGSDPARIVSREEPTLSPGEAKKVSLALAIRRGVQALLLDEPTNHLDLPTIERLERALAAYPGCIVLVTHDDRFAGALTQRTLAIVDGIVAG